MSTMKLDFKFTAEELISKGKTTEENVEKIRNWLSTAKEKFIPIEIQDELLVLFLLSCDNDIEITKKTIVSHYKIKKDAPDIFDQRNTDREDIQKVFKTLQMINLPERTDEDNAIIYFRLRDTNWRNMEVTPIMKASFMLMDIEQKKMFPNGIVYLVDMEGFGLMHLTKIRLNPLMKYFTYLEEGLPIKFEAIHFLNANYVLDRFLAMVRTFLLPHIMKKLYMHPKGLSQEELFKIVPKKCLPQELGGDLQPAEELCKITMELLIEKNSFWEIEEKLRKHTQ